MKKARVKLIVRNKMSRLPRKCTASGCDGETQQRLPFCKDCFMTLHGSFRRELMKSYRSGGIRAIELTNQARDLFLKRKEKMANNDEKIEVDVDVKQCREKSWMVFAGEYEKKGNEQGEVWVCLPRSICNRIDGKEEEEEGPAKFEVPEWIAMEHGLI